MVRIRYGKQETGWAEKLKDGKYRIANVPLEDGLNIDDVVTCKKDDGMDAVDKVVKCVLPRKAVIWYDKIPEFEIVTKVLKAMGCKCEGWCAPGKGRGMVSVAAPELVDPKAVAEMLGIRQDKKKRLG
jgi:hypothetical protein